MAEAGADPAVTRDAFYGGKLELAQPAHGHRSGTDAVLLAAAAPRDLEGLVYDAGAGSGAVGLGIALTCPATRVRLIENDRVSSLLAMQNIAGNGLEARVGVAVCDLLSREERRATLPEPAALVVTNPPFHEASRVRSSPDTERRAAHVMEPRASLAQWLSACLDLLVPKGSLILLHRAEALPAILLALDGRAGAVALMAIHPRASAPARRCLVRAVKGSRAPFSVAPPFVLHEGERFTAEAEAVHRGELALRW